METINYRNKEYYVDGMPSDLKEKYERRSSLSRQHLFFEQDKPVFFYNHKNFLENPDYLIDAVSILRDLNQPPQSLVRNQLIWGIGYGSSLYYAIKAGGESSSDNMFSSHLKVTIADPKTGYDKDVIIMKKYSKEFFEVLITEKEIRDLYNICKTPNETKKIKESNTQGYIRMLYYSFIGKKININKSCRLATKSEIELFKKKILENDTKDNIKKYIDKLILRKEKYLKVSLDEKRSYRTTKEFHKEVNENLKSLNELKDYMSKDI